MTERKAGCLSGSHSQIGRDPADLRMQGQRCRELARTEGDKALREMLLDLARDYEVLAEVLETESAED